MEKLRDENVDFENVRYVLPLDVAQHVDEPLEVLMGGTDPEEVHLGKRRRKRTLCLYRRPLRLYPRCIRIRFRHHIHHHLPLIKERG